MNLLKKIREKARYKGQGGWPELDNTAFAIPGDMTMADLFKQELEKVGGHVYLCQNRKDLHHQLQGLFEEQKWQKPFAFDPWVKETLGNIGLEPRSDMDRLEDMDVGIGVCESLVAWTGSVVVSSALPGGRRFNIFSPDLVIIAKREQLVLEPDEALVQVHNKYSQPPSQITLITGPSKTADIEKTLIYGMHGPRSLHVFIL